MQRPTAASRRLLAHEAGRKRRAGELRRNATRLRGKLAGMTAGAARREGARTARSKQAFEPRIERHHPACAAIPSRKRSPLAQKPAARTNGGKRNRFPEQTRSAKSPHRANPLHIDCVFGTPENWRVRRGCANARLGHAYPWYASILSAPSSSHGFSHKENPLRRPTEEAAAAEAKAAAEAERATAEAAAAEAFSESPELMEADARAVGGKDAVDGGAEPFVPGEPALGPGALLPAPQARVRTW